MLRLFCYVSSAVVAIGAWQAFGHSFGILFEPFTSTVARLWSMLTAGPLLPALGVSAELYFTALALCILIGVSFGLVLARSRFVSDALEPWVFVLYATPTIALVPFISVTLGFGFWPKVLVAVLISIFPILFGVMQGARSLPPLHLDVAAMFGSNERQLWWDVILPYVTPFAMSGIKQSIALTMAGTLVAEFFLNPDGVAAVLLQATTVVNSASVLAVTLFIAILAGLLVGVGELIERRLIRWRDSAVG